MTIPFQFANSGSPQVIQGTGAPDPFAQLIQSLMQGADLGQRASEERGRNSRSSAEMDLEKKKLDIVLADKKSEQIRLKTEGEAIKQMLPVLIQMGAAPQMMGAPQGAQQPQQGAPQPMGLPDVGLVPSGAVRGAQGPKDRFQSIVASLPPEMVGQFVQRYGPMVEAQQAKLDQEAAFDEAEQSTTGLLTPDQQQGLAVARKLFQAGAPKEMWGALMPAAQIDLAKGAAEIRGIKNKREADTAATKKLVDLGLIPASQGGPGVEYVVDGATKMYYDYIADVRKDARQAARERQKEDMAATVKGLEGAALELAVANPDWKGSQIKAALKTNPTYGTLADGVIAKAALEAPESARRLNAPRNEGEARARVTYGPGRAALLTVNAMDLKGQSLGAAAAFAQTDEKMAGLGGAGGGAALGAAIGSAVPVIGTAVGAGVGAAAGGLLGFGGGKIARGVARKSMSEDQQRLYAAALSLAATIYRPESGAAVGAGEIRQTIERYIPLSTDKPQTKELKRVLRQQLDETMANVSGLPQQLQQPIIDGLLNQQEQQLLQAGVPLSTAPQQAQNSFLQK